MIVSVHMPRTAGTSFAEVLERRFGDGLRLDYDDVPVNSSAWPRSVHALQACLHLGEKSFHGVDCVHGHFLPLKYLLASVRTPIRFVTWLRHPVQRIASHYAYWRRSYSPSVPGVLQRRCVEEKWSLERLALGPELRDLYSQLLWGFPLENFEFVGLTEHYAEDLQDFGERFLDGRPAPDTLNATSAGAPHAIDPELAARIEAHHARDMALWRWAAALREHRVRAAAAGVPSA